MTLREFLKTYHIKIPEFAKAIEINPNTLRCWVYGTRKPPIHMLRRIIIQSGFQVSIEDFIDDIDKCEWKPRKLATTKKITVGGLDKTTMRKHERKVFFDDLEII